MIEKAVDIKIKTSLQSPFKTKKIDFRYSKDYKLLAKKKMKSIKSIEIETKTKIRLSPTTPCLLTRISLKLRLLRKTNVIKAAKRAIQPLELISLRLPRKIRIRLKI